MASSEKKIACCVCRRRKTACDRRRPKCGLCTRNNFDCDYVSTDRQPGVRAGYVSQLEQRIALLEQRMTDVELRVPSDLHHDGLNVQQSQNEEDAYAFPANDVQHSPAAPTNADANFGPTAQLQHMNGTSPTLNVDSGISGHIAEEVENASPQDDPISFAVISESCNVWFQRYHPWFPILHQPSFTHILQELSPDLSASPRYIVFQAIVAVTLQHSQCLTLDTNRRQQWQEQLNYTVISGAMDSTTLESVQALLILSNLHFGEGRTLAAWNIYSMCRRISVHLGLRDLVCNENEGRADTSPTAHTRLQPSTNTVIDREEGLRAYWMIEMLDSESTIGAGRDVGLLPPPPNLVLPCSDSIWAFPEDIINDDPLRPFHYSSAFSMCIILAVSELSHVHNFSRKPVAMEVFDERDAWQSEAQRIDERLTIWREEFVAAVYRLINAEYAHNHRPEMDPYIVLTNCILNTAVIELLQRRAPCPDGVEQIVQPWAFAASRCVYACENMTFKVRQMHEEELLICHPHLIFSLFVAARFYIVHSKATDANVPTNLHSLAFALHTCGKRWPLARKYETTIRTAVAEYRTPIAISKVPRNFYDLRYSALDINDAIIRWADSLPAEEANLSPEYII